MLNIANSIYDTIFKYLMEDEYFSAIETRDTAIMNRDAKIKELDAVIEEKTCQLDEQRSQLDEQRSQIEEKNVQLAMSVRMLHNNGLSAEQISVSLGMTEEAVRRMLM